MTALKTTLSQATQKAEMIVGAVESGLAEWQWADNLQNCGLVKEYLAKMKAAVASSGAAELVLADVAQLKRKHDAAHIVSLCCRFKELTTMIQELEKVVGTVWRRHNS